MDINKNRLSFSKEDSKSIFKFLNEENKISFYGDEKFQNEYEENLAKYLKKKYCILKNSGTNALFSAFFAINLKEFDEVLVPTLTFWASVMPLFLLKAKPVLVDSQKKNGNLDLEDLKKKISKKTKAIVITHFPGYYSNIKEIVEFSKKHNLIIIEDISLCIGSKIDNLPLGYFGDISCFSLGSTKLLSGGQGGALVTDNREYYERSILLSYFGNRSLNTVMNPFYRQFSDVGYGLNNRMHVLSVAISKNRFQRIKDLINMRKKRFNILKKYISQIDFLTFPNLPKNYDPGTWHGLYIFFESEKVNFKLEEYVKYLKEKGMDIQKGLSYPLLHNTNFFKKKQDGLIGLEENNNKYIFCKENFPNSNYFANSIILFPLFLDEPLEIINNYGEKLLQLTREFQNGK